MNITKEQKQIIGCDLLPGEVLKVIAFAGTGKTTTLVEYTRVRPYMKFLYIAFNKSVQMEAQDNFPPNVTCRTSHALAFRTHGFKHKDRLVPGFKAKIVMEVFDLKNYEDARFTIDTLTNYLVSTDAKVSRRHIPHYARTFYQEKKKKMPDLVAYANRLGRTMCDKSNDNIGMLHDGYLKLYQLSKPVLRYDCILLDEAQDTNPVTSDFVFLQCQNIYPKKKPASIILVGDSHQQIYSFRGAKDTLKKIKATKSLFLTQSFRFDNNIATVANMMLETFKNENQKIVGTPVNKAAKQKWNPNNYTIIARTNATVFKKAVQLYKNNNIGFVGGINGYRLNIINDIYNLMTEKKVSDSYIRSFSNYNALKSYARDVEDFELLSACKVVEEYKHGIPNHIEAITKKNMEETDAAIILTTAHKAKGLEWNNVLMMDDFQNLITEDNYIDPEKIEPDEFNLIYVAVTRAMSNLRLDKKSSVLEFIKQYKKRSTEALADKIYHGLAPPYIAL